MADGHGGPARGYQWEPFKPGHEMSMVHGGYSERRVGPRAVALADALMNDPETPSYLKVDRTYASGIMAWARAEAVVSLLFEWVSGQDIGEAMTDVTEAEEHETRGEGGSTVRRSTSRRVESVLTQLHRAENRAMALRAALGLTPASRARMPKNFGRNAVDLALLARSAGLDPLEDGDTAGDPVAHAASVTP